MTRYFLGVDIGATKSHALIADEAGRAAGFGDAGPGNHEVVGYDGLTAVLQEIAAQAPVDGRHPPRRRLPAPASEWRGTIGRANGADTLAAIGTLGLAAPLEAINDTLIGSAGRGGVGVGHRRDIRNRQQLLGHHPGPPAHGPRHRQRR